MGIIPAEYNIITHKVALKLFLCVKLNWTFDKSFQAIDKLTIEILICHHKNKDFVPTYDGYRFSHTNKKNFKNAPKDQSGTSFPEQQIKTCSNFFAYIYFLYCRHAFLVSTM